MANNRKKGLRIAIVGAGRVGTALGCLLGRAGHRIVGVSCRSPENARKARAATGAEAAATDPTEITQKANLVFITTPDDAIAFVADQLAACDALTEGAWLIHCSGALSSEVMAPARRCGVRLGSLHPLQSFATARQAVKNLPGSYCCIEGDEETIPLLRRLARDLKVIPMEIPPAGKALYHAAACVACNYFVALAELALRIDQAAGLGRETALASLIPLMRGTLENMKSAGIPQCLTGPISRGDAETVRRHLEALSAALPESVPLYCELGLLTAGVAQAKGTLSKEKAEQLTLIFSEFNGKMMGRHSNAAAVPRPRPKRDHSRRRRT